MRSYKVEKIIEQICRSGFDMTTKDFYEITVYKILKRYGIREKQLDLHEYIELMENIMDLCAENDLKNMGMSYLDNDDFKFK